MKYVKFVNVGGVSSKGGVMPRKINDFQSLLKECERLGLMPQVEVIMYHLLEIQRIVASAKNRKTAPAFARTV